MRLHTSCIPLLAMALFFQPTVRAAIFGDDVPGDGGRACTDAATCPPLGYVGTVSASGGLLSGSLSAGQSVLNLGLGSNPALITFTGLDETGLLGPLGRNPLYYNGSLEIPISGNLITLNVTNTTGSLLTDIAFFLQTKPIVTTNFTSQEDGLSFGIRCTVQINECIMTTPQPLALQQTPTGPAGSILNPADVTPPPFGPETFGDLLRFSNVNLAPQATGAFQFFITDYSSNRSISTSGKAPNSSFTLEVVPGLAQAPVPEPGSLVLGATGILALTAWRKRKSAAAAR